MNNLKTLPSISINDLYIKNGTQKKPFPKWLATVQTKLEDNPKYKEDLVNMPGGGATKKKNKKGGDNPNKQKIYVGNVKCSSNLDMYCLYCKKKTGNTEKCDYYLSDKGTLRMETHCVTCNNIKSVFKNGQDIPSELKSKYDELKSKIEKKK